MASQSKSANNTGRKKSTGPGRGYQLALMTNSAGVINPRFLAHGFSVSLIISIKANTGSTYRDLDKEIDKYSARDSCDSRKETDAVARHQVVSVGTEIFKACCLFRSRAALIAPFGGHVARVPDLPCHRENHVVPFRQRSLRPMLRHSSFATTTATMNRYSHLQTL